MIIDDKQPVIDATVGDVRRELARAMAKFGSFASAHEGYAVLLEEVREFEREVFWGTPARQREEAIQVAAMALRFLVDLPAVRAA
jgi:hypothetical protein